MTLIKTFKLRNKIEIDMFVNNKLLLTITRPISIDTNKDIDFNDIIHFDLLDGYAEMYTNINKPNSIIYYTASFGNQMELILTKDEAKDLLKLTYNESYNESYNDSDNDSDNDSYNESDNESDNESYNEKNDNIELEFKYIKKLVLDRHQSDDNYFIYKIDINENFPITCVSENFYEINSFVNVDCYNKIFIVKNIPSAGVLSEYIDEDLMNVYSRFAKWFGM